MATPDGLGYKFAGPSGSRFHSGSCAPIGVDHFSPFCSFATLPEGDGQLLMQSEILPPAV